MKGHWVRAVALALLFGVWPANAFAVRDLPGMPKLLNLYLDSNIKLEDRGKLWKWDLVVLDMDTAWQNPDLIPELRAKNPAIKILAYVSAGEIATARSKSDPNSPGNILARSVSEEFFMHKSDGNRLSWWPGAQLMNATESGKLANGKRWSDVLAKFTSETLIKSGSWDGVFLDAAYSDIVWFFGNDIDINQDRKADNSADVNSAWQAGMKNLLTKMRTAIGQDKIIISNSSNDYAEHVDGVLYENFPRHGWALTMQAYLNATSTPGSFVSLNTNTMNLETPKNYQLMRFGLASALLGDGFYSFDAGDAGHSRTWWYDEYDVNLGQPLSKAKNIGNIWTREYEGGFVLVNSGKKPEKFVLPEKLKKIDGQQDRKVNDGSYVKKVEMPAEDGLILLKMETGSVAEKTVLQLVTPPAHFVKKFIAEFGQIKNSVEHPICLQQRRAGAVKTSACGFSIVRSIAQSLLYRVYF